MLAVSGDRLFCFGPKEMYVNLDEEYRDVLHDLSGDRDLREYLGVKRQILWRYLTGNDAVPTRHLITLAGDESVDKDIRDWHKHVKSYANMGGKPIKTKYALKNVFPFEIGPREFAICACYLFGEAHRRFCYTPRDEDEKGSFVTETEKIFGEGSVTYLKGSKQLLLKTVPSSVISEIVSVVSDVRLPPDFEDALLVAAFRMKGFVRKNKNEVGIGSGTYFARHHFGGFVDILKKRDIKTSFWEIDKSKWGWHNAYNIGLFSGSIVKFAVLVEGFTRKYHLWPDDKKFLDLMRMAASIDRDFGPKGGLSDEENIYQSLPELVWKRE